MKKYKIQQVDGDYSAWRVITLKTGICLAEFYGKNARGFAVQHCGYIEALPKKDQP